MLHVCRMTVGSHEAPTEHSSINDAGRLTQSQVPFRMFLYLGRILGIAAEARGSGLAAVRWATQGDIPIGKR